MSKQFKCVLIKEQMQPHYNDRSRGKDQYYFFSKTFIIKYFTKRYYHYNSEECANIEQKTVCAKHSGEHRFFILNYRNHNGHN